MCRRAISTSDASGLYRLNEDQIAERGARMARRDDREYREYLKEEQRRPRGCIARRMQPGSQHGLLYCLRSCPDLPTLMAVPSNEAPAAAASGALTPAMHPGQPRCSFLKYARYSRSSRLASRAPRSGIWSLFGEDRPLAEGPVDLGERNGA